MPSRPSDIDATLLQLEILRRIPRRPNRIDAKSLHQQLLDAGFERDLRSIQRILKNLCEHFEIECNDESKPHSYAWLERSSGLALPVLNEQQSLLLKLAEQQLKYLLPSNIMASMKPFFEQADRVVSGAKDKPEYQWLGKVFVSPTSLPLIPAKVKDEIFSAVSQALFKNLFLQIEYKNQHGKKHSAQIMPLALSTQGATIYLVCGYKDLPDYRLLALHRILKAEVCTMSFERPKDFNLNAYQDAGHLGFGNGEKVRLVFSIKQNAGFHLTETPLSQDQKILEKGEDYYRIQATVADNDMLEWWIRKFGDDIWDIQREKV